MDGGPLESALKEQLLVLCLRDQQMLEGAARLLVPEQFAREDQIYALVWRTLVRFWQRYHTLPDRSTFAAEVEAEVAACADYLEDEELETLNTLVELAYTCSLPEDTKSLRQWGLDVAGQWASENLARQVQERVAVAGPRDVAKLLRQFSDEAERIQVGTAPKVAKALFKEGWNQEGARVVPTGIDFFDALLDGGECAGEAYGLLGPQGSCKTTLAVQLICAGVRASHLKVRAGDRDEEKVVYYLISYEGPRLDLMRRIMANLAEISVNSLRGECGGEPLSTADSLKPYELEIAGRYGAKKRGEVERQKLWMPVANRHICLMMLDGSQEELKAHGQGGVDEVVALIEKDLLERPAGTRVGRVVIDFLGAMVSEMLSGSRRARDERPLAIVNAVAQLKKRIAVKHGCPIWILHQLSGAANARKQGWISDDTDAEGGKSYAQRLDFSISIAEPDESNRTVLRATKHRRSAPPPDQVCQIEGEFSRLRYIGDQYAYDPHSKSILPRAELNTIGGGLSLVRRGGHAPSGVPAVGSGATDLIDSMQQWF